MAANLSLKHHGVYDAPARWDEEYRHVLIAELRHGRWTLIDHTRLQAATRYSPTSGGSIFDVQRDGTIWERVPVGEPMYSGWQVRDLALFGVWRNGQIHWTGGADDVLAS